MFGKNLWLQKEDELEKVDHEADQEDQDLQKDLQEEVDLLAKQRERLCK